MSQSQRKRRSPSPRPWNRRSNQDSLPSVRSMLVQCNRRAKAVSYRANMAIPEYWESSSISLDDFPELSEGAKWIRRFIGGFVLLPLAIILSMTVMEAVVQGGSNMSIWLSESVWFPIMGALIWVVLAGGRLFTNQFLYWYVLGHELTHVLAVLMSFGKVSAFRVGVDGGHIQTNKSNLFIALSPYFLPLWALLWAGLYSLLNWFWPSSEWRAILYGGVGFWWAFHLYWTGWIIPRDQPDLQENGTFFSLMIVYLANQILLVGILMLCGFIHFREFVAAFINNATQTWDTFCSLLGWIL